MYAGFVAPGHACGDNSQRVFRNNIAHSIGGVSGGYGAYVYANPADSKSSKCFETSYFTGYKNQGVCMVSFVPTADHRAHNLRCIDNTVGISLNTGGLERDEVEISMWDSEFYGETDADDCPQGHNCYCKPKNGFSSFANQNDGKPLHPTGASSLPIWKSSGEGNWGGNIHIRDTTFKGFMGKSRCGERHVIFNTNPASSDKVPPHFFDNCKIVDTDDSGFAFLSKPPKKWANVKDCGNFPCTAPSNWVIAFTNTKYDGVTPSATPKDFALVPDDETVGGTYPNCVHRPDQ